MDEDCWHGLFDTQAGPAVGVSSLYNKRAVSGYHFAVVSLGKRWEKK